MPAATAVALLASAARTTSGSGSGVDVSTRAGLDVYLEVTAVAGTGPTLSVQIETSREGSAWSALGPAVAVTGVGTTRIIRAGANGYARVSYTIGGTGGPSFTFAVAGDSLTCYAVPDDVGNVEVREAADDSERANATAEKFIERTTYADGYLRASGKLTLPLTAWGRDLRGAVGKLATWDVLTDVVGMNPEDAANSNWMSRRDEALDWLRGVARSSIVLEDTTDTTPTVEESPVVVYTNARRGWGSWP